MVTPNEKERLGDFRFSFNGNLFAELGEESISNQNVALAELIKNSYDANSTVAELRIVDPEKHSASITLEDDGDGMDYSDIKEKFMEVGSPHKRNVAKTKGMGRVPVGAKGIGRFASHSLGNRLLMATAVKGEKVGHELEFDWRKFTPTVKATDIDIPTYKLTKKSAEHGTTLEMRDLKSNWNDSGKIKALIKDLYLLLSPIDPPKKFRIKHSLELSEEVPKIKKDFLEKAAYSFKIKLTKKKEVSLEFKKLGKIERSEKKELRENLSCGDLEFELFFYYKTSDSWRKNTGKDVAPKDLEFIRKVLAEYGGIKLYRDHFRVKPYGDVGADWIGLDKWSRDASDVPGNTQVFGVVSITKDKNPKIEDTTTREGVINNAEYYDLVKFVTTSITEFVGIKNSLEGTRVKARGRKTHTKTIKVEKPKTGNGTAAARQPLLIDIKGNYPSSHYSQIVHEANECNEQNYPNAAFWLSRKIVENLVTHILEKKYPSRSELWYEPKKSRVLNLSQLIENLHSNRGDFTAPGVKNQIEIFKTDVTTMRKAVNSTVHNNHDYLTDRADLKKYKVNKIIQTLVDIYAKI
jgi:hypothetical protein